MDTDQTKLLIRMLKINYGQSLIDLIHIFADRNYEIRLAGETARDLLMHKIPSKMELVSSATLQQMKKLFTKKKISVSIDGKDATIILRYGGKNSTYKIATICPIETVAQTKCAGTIEAYWVFSAYQRVFTVNSIFMDFNGTIYDYFNGCNDVKKYQIRMNLEADTLIKDDYLRILKYFKLYGSIAKADCGHDRKTLEAIRANMHGLKSLKGELIWSEFKSILMQPRRYESLQAFFLCGGATYLGLPDKLNLFEFREVIRKSNFTKHPLLGISYLCAFLETREDVMKLHQRLRLSAYERDLAIFLVKYKMTTRNIDDLVYYRKMCLLPSGVNKQISREYVLELLKYHNKKMLFQNLLLMESPSQPIVPAILQWKKSHLRRVIVEAAVDINDVWYLTEYSMKEPLSFGMDAIEGSVKKYQSTTKKPRLE